MMIMLNAIELLWPATYLTGLLLTIAYFRKGNRAVFILLLLYFALGIYSTTLASSVDRLIVSRAAREDTAALLTPYEAYQRDLDALHMKYPDIVPGTVLNKVAFPLGQMVLVIALYLLGKITNRKTPNQASEATSDPAPGAVSSSPQG